MSQSDPSIQRARAEKARIDWDKAKLERQKVGLLNDYGAKNTNHLINIEKWVMMEAVETHIAKKEINECE